MKQARVIAVRSGDREGIREAASALRDGALAIIPTETVYGLAGDPRVAGVMEKMFEAKGRDRGKPIPCLAADVAAVEAAGAVLGEPERRLARLFWPGPLTMVLRAGSGTEGFRVPDHAVTLALLREVGGILRATSANRSGEPPALTAEEAMEALGDSVDVVVDAGRVPGGVASTVVRVEGTELRFLRAGAIPADRLQAAMRDAGAGRTD